MDSSASIDHDSIRFNSYLGRDKEQYAEITEQDIIDKM